MMSVQRPTRRRLRRAQGSAIAVMAAVAVGATAAAMPASAARPAARRAHVQAPHGKSTVRTVVIPEGGRGGGVDPKDDYPARLRNIRQDSVLDQWGMFNRECVSFVAWALHSRNGFDIPFHDNAKAWGARARARGVRVDTTPAPGAVAWSGAGTYGHVAYVQDVDAGGVHIEEYNYDYNGHYHERVVAASAFTGYIHFRDRAPDPPPAPPAVPSAPVQGPAPPLQGSSPDLQGSPQPVQGTGSAGGGGTSTPSTPPTPSAPTPPATPAAPVSPPPAPPTPPPAPHTWTEQVWSSVGVGTFTGYHNASGPGPRLASGQYVEVSCKVFDPSIPSVMPGGYWYRLASAPFNGSYYSPANSFWNGDIPGHLPYTHSVDTSVPDC